MNVLPAGFNKVPDYDEETGAHLWVMVTVYEVDPAELVGLPAAPMEPDWIIAVTVPACFYCDEPWSSKFARTRCGGRRDRA